MIILDFETYYDHQFSLKKLTIPEYVHDARFHVHGLAIRWPDGVSEFRTDVGAALDQLRNRFGPELEETTVACHHAHFDLYILNHKYDLRPRYFIDTMLLAYHVHGRPEAGAGESAKLATLAQRYDLPCKGDLDFMAGVRNPDVRQAAELAAYARRDVEITAALTERLLPQITRSEVELKILMHSVRLFTEGGVRVDVPGIARIELEIRGQTQEWLDKSGMTPESLASSSQFASALEAALARTGRQVPLKAGKRGLIPAIAKTDAAMQAMLDDDDPAVSALAQARLQKKGEDQKLARLATLRGIARATGGTLPAYMAYYGAHTGRFAGGDGYNIQNLGRSGVGARIRGLLMARPGHLLVIGDLAQIEARITAWLAGQTDMLDAFARDRDLYSEFASSTLGTQVRKPRESDSKVVHDRLESLRLVGKSAVLGLGFGMGALTFLNRLRAVPQASPLFKSGVLNPLKCKGIVQDYRNQYNSITAFWKALDDAARATASGRGGEVGRLRFERAGELTRIWLPSGRALRYPNLRLENEQRTIKYLDKWGQEAEYSPEGPAMLYGSRAFLYGGKLCENVVQAVARDLLVETVLRLESLSFRVLFHVHDEVVVQVDKSRAKEAHRAVEQELSRVPDWAEGLPIACEVRARQRYEKDSAEKVAVLRKEHCESA